MGKGNLPSNQELTFGGSHSRACTLCTNPIPVLGERLRAGGHLRPTPIVLSANVPNPRAVTQKQCLADTCCNAECPPYIPVPSKVRALFRKGPFVVLGKPGRGKSVFAREQSPFHRCKCSKRVLLGIRGFKATLQNREGMRSFHCPNQWEKGQDPFLSANFWVRRLHVQIPTALGRHESVWRWFLARGGAEPNPHRIDLHSLKRIFFLFPCWLLKGIDLTIGHSCFFDIFPRGLTQLFTSKVPQQCPFTLFWERVPLPK